MFSPDQLPEVPSPVFSGTPLLPWVWTRDLYEPASELSDFGQRSSVLVEGYIKTLSEERHFNGNSSSLLSKPYRQYNMAASTTATGTAEGRLADIMSNQYKRHMSKNRPQWYQGHPLDTAPRCFNSWRRNDVPLISDWTTCHQVTAKKAAWMGKVFSHKYYEVNGVIWDWKDPASTLLVDLFASDTMDTVEFAISSDPFRSPHVVVTHSPGEEPEYLDTHGNPDQLTSAPSSIVPNLWGCTPRQSFTGPTGKDQLLLPPRMSMYYEREEYADLCAAATINRRNIFLRVSIRFKEGLRKARVKRERGRDMNTSGSRITVPDSCSEESDSIRDKSKSLRFSDTDAAESLRARGIMLHTGLDDLALMADSAIVSEESEDEDDDRSISTSPRSPTIASDTYEVLRRLGMVDCNIEYEGEESEDEGEREEDEEEEEEEDDESEGIDENEDFAGDVTIPIIPGFAITRESPWTSTTIDPPSRPGSPDLNLTHHTEADEQSSVSSCFIDEDSVGSGSETPDTDDYDC